MEHSAQLESDDDDAAEFLRSVGASSEALANGVPEKARGVGRTPTATIYGLTPPPWYTEECVALSFALTRTWATLIVRSVLDQCSISVE